MQIHETFNAQTQFNFYVKTGPAELAGQRLAYVSGAGNWNMLPEKEYKGALNKLQDLKDNKPGVFETYKKFAKTVSHHTNSFAYTISEKMTESELKTLRDNDAPMSYTDLKVYDKVQGRRSFTDDSKDYAVDIGGKPYIWDLALQSVVDTFANKSENQASHKTIEKIQHSFSYVASGIGTSAIRDLVENPMTYGQKSNVHTRNACERIGLL